jgi:hypothetical protein
MDVRVLDGRASWLEGKAVNVNSQFGEDGLIAETFARLGTTNRWCFEIGAADGVWLSNTKCLRDQGWSAVLIEAQDAHYANLEKLASSTVHAVHRKVEWDQLDDVLSEAGCPAYPDFGCIDIDGQDYWMLQALIIHLPRILLVEFGRCDNADYIPEKGGDGQAGRNATMKLCEDKGYIVLAETFVNFLCVRKDVLDGCSSIQ